MQTFLRPARTARLVAIATMMLTDRQFYGRWVFAPLTFYRLNVTHGLSEMFGTLPWYWYWSSALPAILFVWLPFCLHGVLFAPSRTLAIYAAWTVAAYSLLAHKERRFVLCVLNLLHCYVGVSLQRLFCSKQQVYRVLLRLALVVFVLLNLWITYRKNTELGRGTHDALAFVRHEVQQLSNPSNVSVAVLGGCFATPAFSHLHWPVHFSVLLCPPWPR